MLVDAPPLDVLLPRHRAGTQVRPTADEADLTALYAHPVPSPGGRRAAHVRANMISTLDGAATGADRLSGSINNAADHRVFSVLRAVTDVVLIGAGTARDEGYTDVAVPAGLVPGRRARGQQDRPELVVVSATGALPDRLLDAEHPPLVLTTSRRPDLPALQRRIGSDRVLVAGDGPTVDLARGLGLLADRGLRRVLAEGGPRLLGELMRQRLVDELCLTWSPLVVAGPAPRVIAAADWLTPVVTARPVHLLHADGVLLGRWSLDPSGDPSSWSTTSPPG
ncbi:dihydrofolate reductase family protein [Cellulomonas sp. P24]|uniref:dihydrofolate reductase family protein n=1 Tax=Cellulomonas sp. P24 TaxID=2885206 RepID=UPI00216B2F21|nr:dihydrofolate reductase family protein [Cellulomonas sp. P24]MCR6494283.1 dihydrofolate reductase family protein [Cellulomonas sp. P24]